MAFLGGLIALAAVSLYMLAWLGLLSAHRRVAAGFVSFAEQPARGAVLSIMRWLLWTTAVAPALFVVLFVPLESSTTLYHRDGRVTDAPGGTIKPRFVADLDLAATISLSAAAAVSLIAVVIWARRRAAGGRAAVD